MNDITIPNLDDAILQRLKQRAWQSGLPLEESLRRLLMDAAWGIGPKRDSFDRSRILADVTAL